MAINTLMQMSRLMRPAFWGVNAKVGKPILKEAGKSVLSYWQYKPTFDLLGTLIRLDVIADVSYKLFRKPDDNELFYEVTIWEIDNVQQP